MLMVTHLMHTEIETVMLSCVYVTSLYLKVSSIAACQEITYYMMSRKLAFAYSHTY